MADPAANAEGDMVPAEENIPVSPTASTTNAVTSAASTKSAAAAAAPTASLSKADVRDDAAEIKRLCSVKKALLSDTTEQQPSKAPVASDDIKCQMDVISVDDTTITPKMGRRGYFGAVLVITLFDAAVAVGVWSSMGCDIDCIKFFVDNEWMFYLTGGLSFSCIVLLYILDFFIPPHMPDRTCCLWEGDKFVGPGIVMFALLNFFFACFFCARSYPSAPLLLTVFALPVMVAAVRQMVRPQEPAGLTQHSDSASFDKRMEVLEVLILFEEDQKAFYSMAGLAMAIVGLIVATAWIIWAFATSKGQDTLDTLDALPKEYKEYTEVMIILWAGPAVAAITYLLFACISCSRVLLAGSYTRTDAERNELAVNSQTSDGAKAANVQKQVTALKARLTQRVGKVDTSTNGMMSSDTKQRYLGQHSTYMKKLTGALKMTICAMMLILCTAYIVTQLVDSDSHLAAMAQGFLGAFFLTIIGFVYISFNRIFRALLVWIEDMPLFKSMAAFTTNDWARAWAICMCLPMIPFILFLSAINQCVRRCRNIYQKVPQRQDVEGQMQTTSPPEWCRAGHPDSWHRDDARPEEFKDVAKEIAKDKEAIQSAVLQFLDKEVVGLADGGTAQSSFTPFMVDPGTRIIVEFSATKSADVYILSSETIMSTRIDKAASAFRMTLGTDSDYDMPIEVEVTPADLDSFVVTERVHKQIQRMAEWKRISIIQKVYILGLLFALYTISPRALNVFLSWLSNLLKDLPLAVICLVTFLIGLFLFLLPPVPGAPVYLFGGVVITQKYMNDNPDQSGAFVIGSTICIILCFCLKLVACATQQKVIGENLGNNMWIRQNVGVHKSFIRALEQILSQSGLSFGKCCVLMGGPDWPTSVLCGVLKLSLFQCLLGTAPIIMYVTPLALTGCFYVMQNDAEIYTKLGSMMFILTFIITATLWVAIAWVVQTEMDNKYEMLTRPMVKYVDLDWLDYRAERAEEKRVVVWGQVPGWLKYVFVLGAINVNCVAWGFYQYAGWFFGTFEVTDDFNTLEIDPTADSAIITLLGYIGLAVLFGSYTGKVIFGNWQTKVTAELVTQENDRLDKFEAEWKKGREELARSKEPENSSSGSQTQIQRDAPDAADKMIEPPPSSDGAAAPMPSAVILGQASLQANLPADDTDAVVEDSDIPVNTSSPPKASSGSVGASKVKKKQASKRSNSTSKEASAEKASAEKASAEKLVALCTAPPRQPSSFPKTPKDLGMDFENVAFNSTDGVQLKAWFMKQSSTNKMVIVNHPLACSRYGYEVQKNGPSQVAVNFLPMLKHLHSAGYSILTYDQRGHGESADALCGAGEVEHQDLLGALDYVKNEDKTKEYKIALITHCMGATAAFKAIALNREVFDSHVLALVACQPVSMRVMIETMAAGAVTVDSVDAGIKAKSGNQFGLADPRPYIPKLNIPVFFSALRGDDQSTPEDVQQLYDMVPQDVPKDIVWPDDEGEQGAMGSEVRAKRFEGFNYFGEKPDKLLEFLSKYVDNAAE